MGRILSIDFGKKRTGIAVTDPLQIIVSGLTALDTSEVLSFLDNYFEQEDVSRIVVGYPFFDEVYNPAFKKEIDAFIERVRKRFSGIPVDLHDESFTSHRARSVILASGAKRKKRRNKKLVDKVSAVIILQEYLGHI